ncbi:glycosyltransferase family 4 protein [Flavitalea sp.]|nr:glycosyltransferase family 1 protein [Flavitalea sp.]
MKPANKTRIFVDAHVFDSEYQGTRTFIREIYLLLAGKPDLELYLAAFDIQNLKKEFKDNDSIVFVPYRNKSSVSRLLFELPRLLTKLEIDIAHFQYIVPPIKNARYLVTTHDVIFNEFPEEFSLKYRYSKNFLFGYSAKRSDILTTVSHYSERSIRKFLKIRNKPISVIPNGVSKRFFESFDKTAAEEYILNNYGVSRFVLYVSRFEPRKNHVLVLQSFLDLGLFAKGFQLVLLGHRSLEVPGFDTLYNSLPPTVQSCIFINSRINDKDLLEFYRAAQVFVYPSKAEGFGIPPLEAGALKIPVLCSNASAMSDFTFFGENHFDPTNQAEFNNKLARAIDAGTTDPNLESISNTIREQYSWQSSAQKLYELIKQASV